MKPPGTLLSTAENKIIMTKHDQKYSTEELAELFDNHMGSAIDTPLRSDAFDLSDEEKISQIASKFEDIMTMSHTDFISTLGIYDYTSNVDDITKSLKESNKEFLLEKVQEYLELDVEDGYIWDDFGFKAEYLFY